MKTRAISSQAAEESAEGSTTNAYGPERTMERHERAAARIYTDEQKAAKKAYKQRRKEHYAMLNRKYREAHKDELRVYGAQYRASNRLKLKEQQRNAYVRNFEKDTERRRAYYARNAQAIIAKKRERRQSNPCVLALHNSAQAKRRASLLRAMPVWADKAAIQAKYEQAQRLTLETGIEHHVDHIIPLSNKSVSGLHVENNLRVVTAVLNLKKRNVFLADEIV